MTINAPHFSRRRFLGSMLTLAGTGAAPFALNLAAMGNAAAQSAGDYKAMVCLFLNGGNDAFNTVLATDSASWNEYLGSRRLRHRWAPCRRHSRQSPWR